MKRRRLLKGLAGLGVAGGIGYWLSRDYWDGFIKNPCFETLPEELKQLELWQTIWQGVEPSQIWDCHVHTVGLGESGSGIWVNPKMQSRFHPVQLAQFKFYLNASCIGSTEQADTAFLSRLKLLVDDMPKGFKAMLFAFDYHYGTNGLPNKNLSTFYVPNEYSAKLASESPEHFEWVASIHPYRSDAIDELEKAKEQGARAVKWLPPAQNMDPMSDRCVAFYKKMEQLDIPLICHAGTEKAVQGSDTQELGNPLRLRTALDNGVKIVVAHCASLGKNQDLDSSRLSMTDSFDLFTRMMSEYPQSLYGEISAILQINRQPRKLKFLLENTDWHSRLLNGSDYPLPAVMPLISIRRLIKNQLLDKKWLQDLNMIRQYNALLFDFAVKRLLSSNGHRFSSKVFETKAFF